MDATVVGRPSGRPVGSDAHVHKLYVVHSSHPSQAVRKALALKGIPYKTVELLIPTQAPLMRLRFGQRTVPALKLDGGAKVSGSRAIMRTLDELVPDPPLLPSAATRPRRAAVLDAERWGDEVLQPLVRRLVWAALKRDPAAIPSYQQASQLPRLPGPVVRLVAPGVIAIERRMNRAERRRGRARTCARCRPPGPRRRHSSPPACSAATPTSPTPPTCRSAPRCGCWRRSATRARCSPARPGAALGDGALPRLPRRHPGGRLPAGLAAGGELS